MGASATVVLVHGAFADASGYAGVIRRLQGAGMSVRSNQDNAIHPEADRFMARRINATTESIDGSHAAFIAYPNIAAALILKAVAAA